MKKNDVRYSTNPELLLDFDNSPTTSQINVFLTSIPALCAYSEVELNLSYYPYQKEIAADDYHFDPYEDYVFDLTEGKRSTYQSIPDSAPQAFGLFVGGVIFSYFLIFFPQLLVSVESVVSIFAAYTVGKEIWRDVDGFLQSATSGWQLRWVDRSFHYVLQQFGTLQRFWQFARQKRYGYQLTLPYKIDFISHSNSKTVEMLFRRKDLRKVDTQKVRVLGINYEKNGSVKVELPKGLVICRLVKIKKFWGIKFISEWYQSYDNGKVGTVDTENIWHNNKSLQKTSLAIGRIILWRKEGVTVDERVVGLTS